MTTIVYDHKARQIAVDSRCTANGIIRSDSDIKYRYSGSVLFFLCGQVSDHKLLIDAYNGQAVKECESYAMAVIDGVVHLCGVENERFWIEPVNYSCAMGSGGNFALSALDHGAGATDAVKYAFTRDYYSGGIIRLYDIESARFVE